MDGKRRYNGAQPPPKRLNMPPADGDDEPGMDMMEEEEMADVDVFMGEETFMEAELESLPMEEVQRKLDSWARPRPQDINIYKDSIVFQQLEIDYVIGDSKQMVPGRDFPAAILRVFGVTGEGHSVCALVHGFEPYFYVRAPAGLTVDDLPTFRRSLERMMGNKGQRGDLGKSPPNITDVVLVRKQTVMHYQEETEAPFLKIVMALPMLVAACRGILESGFCWMDDGRSSQQYLTYESTVLFTLRFMIDCAISGGNWIELPPGKYRSADRPISWCQLEYNIHYCDLVSHSPVGQWSRMAPFRILSFDIECCGRKGHFPEPEKDPVIQIANLVTLQGQSEPLVRNVMTLDTCAPITGAHVMAFKTEQELLLAWRDLVQKVDPDVIIGYNICKFDLPYLIERAQTLQVAPFQKLGRIRNSNLRVRDSKFQSRQYGTRESKEITIEGRVQLDLLQAIQRDYKLSSYSLNAVSAHFLNEQKEDVHHSIIADLQGGTAETRRRLAVYCLKDAYLPQRLLDKLKYVFNYVEMARVTGVPISFLLSRGQSIKVLSQILRKSRERNLLVPNLKTQGAAGESYEGATVLEPKTAYYDVPVATLDFASLYPSIMMAHNLCYCSLVRKEDVHRLPAESVVKTPTGDVFVKASVTKGILPEILEELLGARKRAKSDLKAATDPFEKAVLDGRQLALKISANSVYGFTGATVGALPCLEISSSVTAYGREMIELTKSKVEETYTVKNGYSHEADVIYGDTDSVMVRFGVSTVEEAMRLGKEAADLITNSFPKPIKLEFEKVYFPYLLINKKRYAGLLWTSPDKYDKMDAKGIETVRRDNCLLVKNLVTESLRLLLVERRQDLAIAHVKEVISDLLMNRIDLSLLVITKGLSKSGEEYSSKTAHGELALKMRARDAATAPGVGDRVPYVIIKGAKGAKAFEKSEDPIFVLDNNIPIDPHYYLENQLSKPLLRIFEPIMKNAEQKLLHGDHTRSVAISTPSTGGIMRFAKVKLSCMGCKTPLTGTDATLCSHCVGREAEIYQRTIASVREVEQQFNRLWTQCQRCQGSLHQEVLCTSRDCPIFYRRRKAQKDLVDTEAQLQRFDF